MFEPTEAEVILERFAPQRHWVVNSTMQAFDLPHHLLADLEQDVSELVLSYAGLMPGRHYGILKSWTKVTGNDERQIKSLLAYELRIDLAQLVARSQKKEHSNGTTSLESLLENNQEPIETDFEETMVYRMDSEDRYRKRYPEFTLHVIDGMPQVEIADKLQISDRTVRNRIAAQKRSFLADRVRRAGLRTEGTETFEELQEALDFLGKAGRT
jgi:hypothetical protein